jgi:hypothetical protein
MFHIVEEFSINVNLEIRCKNENFVKICKTRLKILNSEKEDRMLPKLNYNRAVRDYIKISFGVKEKLRVFSPRYLLSPELLSKMS